MERTWSRYGRDFFLRNLCRRSRLTIGSRPLATSAERRKMMMNEVEGWMKLMRSPRGRMNISMHLSLQHFECCFVFITRTEEEEETRHAARARPSQRRLSASESTYFSGKTCIRICRLPSRITYLFPYLALLPALDRNRSSVLHLVVLQTFGKLFRSLANARTLLCM